MAKYISKFVTMGYFTILHHSTQFSSNNPSSDAEALKRERTLDNIKFSLHKYIIPKRRQFMKMKKNENKKQHFIFV